MAEIGAGGARAPAALQKVMLISIDGWGITSEQKGNAIFHAKTPVMSQFERPETKHLHSKLDASGLSVGLPRGLMGNSEVGHLTMGAGRAQFQDLVRINLEIEDGSFFKNQTLLTAFKRAREGTRKVHFLGLVSDGGVHSHIEHLFALLRMAKDNGVPEAFVHFFADGRDVPPSSAVKYIEQLQSYLRSLGYGRIATLMGRYYAMDRDTNWARTKSAYDALLKGVGQAASDGELVSAVKKRYEAKETDEFLKPFIVDKRGLVEDGDTLVFFDFRADRMRQIVQTLGVKPLFEVDVVRKELHVVQYTQYNASFPLPIAFPPQNMDNVLTEWLSKHGIRQFHTAETEKYAHVTFFFNGGTEKSFPLEDRELIPSPKVATYDLQPEMSVGERVVKALSSGLYPFVMCNLAPPDMVGHTGVYDATITAVEATDQVVGQIIDACQKNGYVCVITADHGNAEEMLDEKGDPKTSHTTNLVPLNIVFDKDLGLELSRKEGTLADVAPTVLQIMGMPAPSEMTGKSMLRERAKRAGL